MPDPVPAPTTGARPPPGLPGVLWLFTLCNFVVGTGAFGISGYLGPLAADLRVGVGAAGQTMTAYALANALLAPMIMLLTAHWPRRTVMRLALGLFGAGALVCTLAPNLGVLMAGRVLMGAGAVFTPVAAGVAVSLVAPEQRGKALSRTFLGMSLSYVLGMPLGAWLGLAWPGLAWLGLELGAASGGAAIGWLGFERLSWLGAAFAVAGWLTLLRRTGARQPVSARR